MYVNSIITYMIIIQSQFSYLKYTMHDRNNTTYMFNFCIQKS